MAGAKRLIKKLGRFLTDPSYRTRVLADRGFYDRLSDRDYLEKLYRAHMGRPLELEHPETLNEKLQWLKLYYRDPLHTVLVDKYRVRDYVAEKLGEEHLIPLLGVWDDPDEIDFDRLPTQFVLKCNHNSGLGMYICRDKSRLDPARVRAGLRRGLAQDYFLHGREWPYKNVPRKIIGEQYLADASGHGLRDYKFYCFDGRMALSMINSDRFSPVPTKADYFDRNFDRLDFTWGYQRSAVPPERPEQYDQMIAAAEKLAVGLPHVRVDLYLVGGRIYFGELTFFDGSGFSPILPQTWDRRLGALLCLPERRADSPV